MPLLIDGYNLLHVSGILGRNRGPGGLQASRLALLNFLAESLDPAELPRTTIVFDAGDPPWGMPRKVTHRGITVRFAARYESADDQIEELILKATDPRRLIVVSSDHRIQRAAKRRRAKAIDSDVWYAELIRVRRERLASSPEAPARPAVPLLEEDVNYWLRQFGGESALTEFLVREAQTLGHPIAPNASSPPEERPNESEPKPPSDPAWLDNPFPPGYADDLLED